jgi:hypothetical protein
MKVKKGDGKPTPNELITLHNMQHIIGTISVLLTGCTFAIKENVPLSPVSREDKLIPITLSADDQRVLFSNKFLVKYDIN